VNFPESPLIGSGRDPVPFSNQAFNARLKLACERARVPVISAHPDSVPKVQQKEEVMVSSWE
jgi:2-oxo-4-hydroxy-4-carboxy--5-ureidoimidazoline (OHCU) decarboxylase